MQVPRGQGEGQEGGVDRERDSHRHIVHAGTDLDRGRERGRKGEWTGKGAVIDS